MPGQHFPNGNQQRDDYVHRIIRRIVGGMVASITAFGLVTALGAAPAQAQTNLSAYSVAANGYASEAGVTRFTAYGDKITLFDQDVDGAGVHGDWYYEDENDEMYPQNDLYWGGGGGTSHTWDFNIPEDVTVTVIVCLKDNGAIMLATCATRHEKN